MSVMCKKRLLGVLFVLMLMLLVFSCMTLWVIEERRGRMFIMVIDLEIF